MLGVIEGFYGRPWTMCSRRRTIAALHPHGYGFYIYAPKADSYLRREWRTPYPERDFGALASLAEYCQSLGVSFGLGFSPYALFRNFDQEARGALAVKLAQLRALEPDLFAILFDDMPGNMPQLAEAQLAITDAIGQQLPGTKLAFCPTYYSDDPVLDRAFGRRPADYLDTIGRQLDPSVAIFWTGPEICSHELSPGHVDRISEHLRRKPFLWDNYPVNDGPRMSRYLHIRAVTGRTATATAQLEGHAVNPSLQPTLTQIPAITLAMAYRDGAKYDYGWAFREAATAVCGPQLADYLSEDLSLLNDVGLERLSSVETERLRARYGGIDHDAAREVLGFLNREYHFEGDMS